MDNIQCLSCEHFRVWDGDPCCLEPKNGWMLTIPDITRNCDSFELRSIEDSEENDIWKNVWEEEKEEFFKTYKLNEPLYSKYIEEHPEYKGKIEKNA